MHVRAHACTQCCLSPSSRLKEIPDHLQAARRVRLDHRWHVRGNSALELQLRQPILEDRLHHEHLPGGVDDLAEEVGLRDAHLDGGATGRKRVSEEVAERTAGSRRGQQDARHRSLLSIAHHEVAGVEGLERE